MDRAPTECAWYSCKCVAINESENKLFIWIPSWHICWFLQLVCAFLCNEEHCKRYGSLALAVCGCRVESFPSIAIPFIFITLTTSLYLSLIVTHSHSLPLCLSLSHFSSSEILFSQFKSSGHPGQLFRLEFKS